MYNVRFIYEKSIVFIVKGSPNTDTLHHLFGLGIDRLVYLFWVDFVLIFLSICIFYLISLDQFLLSLWILCEILFLNFFLRFLYLFLFFSLLNQQRKSLFRIGFNLQRRSLYLFLILDLKTFVSFLLFIYDILHFLSFHRGDDEPVDPFSI